MFEAHVNGKDIAPEDYNEEQHKGKMQCPDKMCRDDEKYNPEMRYNKGAENVDAGSKETPKGEKTGNKRKPHFFTYSGEHHPDCTAYIHEYAYRESYKKLEDGGYVLFNLAFIPEKVTDTFNVNAAKAPNTHLIPQNKWKKDHKGYRPVCIHHTETIVKIIDRIKEDILDPDSKLDEHALERCGFHSGAFVVSYEDFDLREQPKKLDILFRSMASKLEGALVSQPLKSDQGEEWVFGFPRLVSIKNIKPRFSHCAQGSEQIIQTQKGAQRLTHVIKPKNDNRKETRQQLIEHEAAYIVASPHTELKHEWIARQRNTMHYMGWSIHNERQVVPFIDTTITIETDPDSQQKRWNFG